jgi:uncharacterized Zn-binding protein involved in type VI secretion
MSALPAARLGHRAFCGIHGTGSIATLGASAINVTGKPASRLSDQCECHSAPHAAAIIEGSATVLMNGLPAARLNVKTATGGEVIQGEPSVRIGGPTFSLPPFVVIEGTPEFQARAYRHFFMTTRTRSGQLWLESFAKTGKRVTIRDHKERKKGPKPAPHCITDPQLEEGWFPPGGGIEYNDRRAYDGTGVDSTIEYDPVENNDASLFHEMVHADDMAHGSVNHTKCENRVGDEAYVQKVPCGERKATGLSPYDDTSQYPFSEATYRKERGYPPETYY